MTELTEKGRRTLELAARNQETGGSVHCWAEGGDQGMDYEVPSHLEEALNRAAELRNKEMEETTKRMQAKQSENGSSLKTPEV